jgi:ABC-2 type transport system ATP-binding protein
VAHLLVRNNEAAEPAPSGWEADPVGLEELVLAYLREPGAAALPGPRPRATQNSGVPA